MAIENINVGALPNDGSGDAVRTAFGKVNNNFDEVDTRLDTAQGDADSAGATADAAIPATEKGAANGVPTLDSTGKVPFSQMPPMMGAVDGGNDQNAVRANGLFCYWYMTLPPVNAVDGDLWVDAS